MTVCVFKMVRVQCFSAENRVQNLFISFYLFSHSHWTEQYHFNTHYNIQIHKLKKKTFFLSYYKTMQTWWVFYLFIVSIKYVFSFLFNFHIGHSKSKSQTEKKTNKQINIQGHTRIFYTHTFYYFLSRSPKWFSF